MVGWSLWGDLNPSGRNSFCRVESERYTFLILIQRLGEGLILDSEPSACHLPLIARSFSVLIPQFLTLSTGYRSKVPVDTE